jgi:hypothetical protein
MSSTIPIQPHDLTLTATSIHVDIYEFQFGSHIRLKISFFDSSNTYLLHKFVMIEGTDYVDMTTGGDSDGYIRAFVEAELGLTIDI